MDAVEKMRSGKIYFCTDPELVRRQTACLEVLYDYNATRPSDAEARAALLKRLLGSCGEDCYVEPPLHANWGCHTHFGRGVYANFNLTLVDDADIFVGDFVMFAPNVTLSTAGHPIDPALRLQSGQFNLPVHIGNNVWIGANAVVMPGVTIGENSVIGAGSVVTKDIPANVVAYGVPCRVIRPIGEYDKQFYRPGRPVEIV